MTVIELTFMVIVWMLQGPVNDLPFTCVYPASNSHENIMVKFIRRSVIVLSPGVIALQASIYPRLALVGRPELLQHELGFTVSTRRTGNCIRLWSGVTTSFDHSRGGGLLVLGYDERPDFLVTNVGATA